MCTTVACTSHANEKDQYMSMCTPHHALHAHGVMPSEPRSTPEPAISWDTHPPPSPHSPPMNPMNQQLFWHRSPPSLMHAPRKGMAAAPPPHAMTAVMEAHISITHTYGSTRPPPSSISRRVASVSRTRGSEPPERWYRKQRYTPSVWYVSIKEPPFGPRIAFIGTW